LINPLVVRGSWPHRKLIPEALGPLHKAGRVITPAGLTDGSSGYWVAAWAAAMARFASVSVIGVKSIGP
jgi:hypothetical protein